MENGKNNSITVLLLITLFAVACKSSKNSAKSKKNTSPKETRIITAGEGGGITGLYTVYRIKPDSFLYSVNYRTNDSKLIAKISETEMNQVYTLLDESSYEGIDYNKPGNMTDFVDINDNGEHYKIIWAKNNGFPPEKIKQLHDLIFKIAAKYKF